MAIVTIKGVEFSDETQIPIGPVSTVVFVGPNNAGKSQALKDILGCLEDRSYHGPTIACHYVESDPMTFQTWAQENVPTVQRNGDRKYLAPSWSESSLFELTSLWESNRSSGLGSLTELFVLHADGTSRLETGNPQMNFDIETESPTHPVQRLLLDPLLEEEIDKECRSAFPFGIVLDRLAGTTIALRVGDRPDFEHVNGAPTAEYIAALKSLPTLEDQGDGVRSYVGLLLHVLGGSHDVLLIDEPEAFLHPPQARHLGRVLASRNRGVQLFISTHSADVVQGALESPAPVTIVRITREDNVNNAAVLEADALEQLWSDPILRYSNILDGLFHDAVVICEADADCTYYSAVLDHVLRSGLPEPGSSARPQILFTHTGGKSRMHSVIKALRSVKVPVVAVADFDVLRDLDGIRKIVEALGGNYSDIETDLRILSASLNPARPLRRLALRDAINSQLDGATHESLTAAEAEVIRNLAKAESGWDRAKVGGVSALPPNDPSNACERLLGKLEEWGLLVVPVGELERFDTSIGGHGPAWVSGVLEGRRHTNPPTAAKEFVSRIWKAAQEAAGLTLTSHTTRWGVLGV